MKGFWDLFRKKDTKPVPAAEVPLAGTCREPYLTQTVVFGMHLYRSPGEDSSVYFVDESRGIRKMLVDSDGRIQRFPGIVKEAFWTKQVSPNALKPEIHFRTSFEKREDRWLMLWQIQPDGRYWEDDDGFGSENELEITLYTYVDRNGDFTEPFRIYAIGDRMFSLDRFEHAHVRMFAQAVEEFSAGTVSDDWFSAVFPWLNMVEIYMGFSRVSDYYTLFSGEDARNFWEHPVLSGHLRAMTEILLAREESITDIVGYPNNRILHSCMTLFWKATEEPVFKAVLDKFFEGKTDEKTDWWLARIR